MDRKNHKKVFTIEDTNSQLYISSKEERDEYEYNTNTLLRLLIRTRETATLFSSTFNKSGACLLSETCARRSPPIRGSVQKDALTVTSAAGEFSIRRAHGAPLESIRLCFVFLSSFFLFHFGGRLVFSSFFSRPTERKPKREEGVLLRGDIPNLIALRDASRGAVITRHVPEAETLVASFFGHVALTQRFRFRFRRASSFVVLVVERPIRSNDGCLCRRHLLRARTSDAFFSPQSSRRKTLIKSLHSSTHTNKQTHKEREREVIKENVKKGEKNIMCTVDKVRRTKPRLVLLFSSARARERSHLVQSNLLKCT